ncbi:MAG: zinc-dependent metalloprotease [Kineosporiaceae bacterium]
MAAATQRIVDWNSVAEVAARVVPAGPAMTRDEVDDLVADLRDCARRAVAPVVTTARMAGGGTGETLVVDRAGWARANATSFGALLDPVLAASPAARAPGPAAAAAGRAVTAAETGAVLAYVSTKVLGQYDVLHPDGRRLLLVAPNIARTERELGVDPSDFRLWVCLHEETHRVQFAATPWLAPWFTSRVRELVGDLVAEPGTALDRALEVLSDLPAVVRAVFAPADERERQLGLLDLVQTPEQRERIDELTAVMSLLEGHADVVMDEVGPAVVPSVAEIRRRFMRRRRTGGGPVDRAVRRALGLDAKARQYRAGAAFVRAAVDEVGVNGFNAVWAGPDALPSAVEISDPGSWVRRVHG